MNLLVQLLVVQWCLGSLAVHKLSPIIAKHKAVQETLNFSINKQYKIIYLHTFLFNSDVIVTDCNIF